MYDHISDDWFSISSIEFPVSCVFCSGCVMQQNCVQCLSIVSVLAVLTLKVCIQCSFQPFPCLLKNWPTTTSTWLVPAQEAHLCLLYHHRDCHETCVGSRLWWGGPHLCLLEEWQGLHHLQVFTRISFACKFFSNLKLNLNLRFTLSVHYSRNRKRDAGIMRVTGPELVKTLTHHFWQQSSFTYSAQLAHWAPTWSSVAVECQEVCA